jgi:hypothetical protein
VRTWTIRTLLIALNAVVFLAAWAGGLSLRPIILAVPIWRSLGGEYAVLAAGASLTFVLAGAVTRLWSRHWTMVAVPALVSFELGLTLLGMAIYLGDGGAEDLMWSYILPDRGSWAAGVVAAAFAVAGYFAAAAFRKRHAVAV